MLVKLTYGGAKGFFIIPGGFVEPGETLLEAVRRELHEETGVDVEPEGVLGVRSMVRQRDHLTDLYCVVKCRLTSGPTLQRQEEEVAEARWFTIEEALTSPEVLSYTKTIIKKALGALPMLLDRTMEQSAKERLKLVSYEQFWVQDFFSGP